MDVTLEKVYESVMRKFPELEKYFPDYDENYLPPRQYFWDVLTSVKPHYVKNLMNACFEKRCGVGEEQDEMEMIKIRTDLFDEIKNAQHVRSKFNSLIENRGWSLFLLKEKCSLDVWA